MHSNENSSPSSDEFIGANAEAPPKTQPPRASELNVGSCPYSLCQMNASVPFAQTIENFCTHSRNGYYDGVIFHRVIKGFMVQTVRAPVETKSGGGKVQFEIS